MLKVSLNPKKHEYGFEVCDSEGNLLGQGDSISVPNGTILKVIPKESC
jgi:hypothetical protein